MEGEAAGTRQMAAVQCDSEVDGPSLRGHRFNTEFPSRVM